MGITISATVAEVMESHKRQRHIIALLNQIEDHIESTRQGRRDERDKSIWRQHADSFKSIFSS